MDREYLQSKNRIKFDFEQNEQDFIVDEMPHTKFKGKGNYLILHVKKVQMTTWDMIAAFAEYLEIPAQEIGYAGLKDKHATTTQYISFLAKHEYALKKFKHPTVTILETIRHSHSIRMGDLAGNRFSINLYGVEDIEAGQIEKIARKSEKNGMPNYFGYQRFGRDGDSITQAKEMIEGDLFITDTKVKNFLVSVYQSVYFNDWLKERIVMSREENGGKFLLLEGDVYMDSNKKLFTPKKPPQKDFEAQKIVPSGLLCGRDVFRARDKAREIEEKYDDGFLQEKGYRREALVFPKVLKLNYNKNFSKLNLLFELPKGSYATVFLENISNRNLKAKKIK